MADVGFGTVHGRYLTADVDSSDPDIAPDLVPYEGCVFFTPTAPLIFVVGGDPAPATIIPQSVRVALDADGYLAVDGSHDVTLLATDSAAGNPVDWQWRVDFALTRRDGVPVYRAPFNFELPEGAIVDLTVVAPLVEPSPGTIIIQGPPGSGSGSAPDATALIKGILRLTGDLGGTALSPTVPGLADKSAIGHTHTQAEIANLVSDLLGKAALSHTHAEADVVGLVTDLGLKAPLASPTFTGTPRVPTPTAGDNDTKIASTAFVQAAVAALIASSPAALDTLNELAAALGNDPNFATTIATSLGLKAPLASPVFTGNPTAPTPTAGDNDTSLATTAFVQTASGLLIPKSLVDAKGDLIIATANDTPARLAIGANGTVLTADSAEATGAKWAAPSGGGGSAPKMMPYRSGDIVMPLGLNETIFPGYIFDGYVMGCLVRLDMACNLQWARIEVNTATGVAGATADLVIYQASTEALIGTFGSVAIDSTGTKTATPGSPIAITTPDYYLVALRVRASIGTSAQVRSFKSAGLGQTVRAHDFGYPPEATLAYTVAGTGAAPASLTSHARAAGGPASNAPIIAMGVTP